MLYQYSNFQISNYVQCGKHTGFTLILWSEPNVCFDSVIIELAEGNVLHSLYYLVLQN